MRNDLGTQVGAIRRIPAEASKTSRTSLFSVFLGKGAGFLAGAGAGLALLVFFLARRVFFAMPMNSSSIRQKPGMPGILGRPGEAAQFGPVGVAYSPTQD